MFDKKTLYIISLALLLAVAITVSIRRREEDRQAGRWLGAYLWTFLITIFISYVFTFGYGEQFIHLLRTAQFTFMLVMPCSFLYMRRVLKGREFRPKDLLHFLLPLIYLVDMAPFFLLSAAAKVDVLKAMTPADLNLYYDEGWFMPRYGHVLLRYGQVIFYWVMQILLLRQNAKNNQVIIDAGSTQWRWLIWLTVTQMFTIILPGFVAVFFSAEDALDMVKISTLIAVVGQCYFLLLYPAVLYSGASIWFPAVSEKADKAPASGIVEVKPEAEADQQAEHPYYTQDMLDEVATIVRKVMEDRKPFLSPSFGLREMANVTGISMHKLSAYINRLEGKNFHGYVNEMRIQYCLGKLEDGDQRMKTLEAIGQESGFQSRVTFIRAFKKVTGVNPSQYKAGIQNNEL